MSRPPQALITGPDGTPYENGCFIFDILLGGNYNQGPPNVSCKTTKGDRYRLNPNLYACGKVCLSLLGTWSGECGRRLILGQKKSADSKVSRPGMGTWKEHTPAGPDLDPVHDPLG